MNTPRLNRILASIGIVALWFSGPMVYGADLVHPGLLSTKAQLDFIKEKVSKGEQPWTAAYNKLRNGNPEKRNPNFRATISGTSNHGPMDEMTLDGSNAYACALIWYISGDKKYADHAIKLLNAWTGFQKHDNWLFLSWAVPQFLNAAEIMAHVNGSGWTAPDIQKFTGMVRQKWLPAMQNKTWVNNAMHSTIEGQIATAIFLDDKEELKRAVGRWSEWTRGYFYLKEDGNQPILVGRAELQKHWGKGPFYDGQCMETCRDLNHARLGGASVIYSAEMAYNQGIDVWKQEQKRMGAFAELHSGWLLGDDKVPGNICGGDKVWCAGGVSWSSKRGHPPDCGGAVWEMVLNHVQVRLGNPLPKTQKMAVKHRPGVEISKRNKKFETLTHADLPMEKLTSISPIVQHRSWAYGEGANLHINANHFPVQVQVFDILGNRVYNTVAIQQGSLSLHNLKLGVYSVRFEGPELKLSQLLFLP